MKPAPGNSSTLLASHTCTYRAICSFLIFVFLTGNVFAQDTGIRKIDSILPLKSGPPYSYDYNYYPFNKNRVKLIAATHIAGYGASMAGFYSAWYKDYPQSRFHTFNDFAEWKQIDKFGHIYGAYAAGRASMELWRWSGISRKKRIWIGGMSGAAYQTVIETLDGFSAQWGWSWTDFTSNILGSAALVAQELAWDEQRIQLKWSFHRKRYDDPALNTRSNEIFGRGNAERFLKDYNGQTYWISTTLRSFFPSSGLPPWLQVSVGTGAEGLFGARENIGKDKSGNIIFNRPEIRRYRQWYLAPDVDLTKIRTRRKGVRFALNVLSIIKIPSPSIEYSNGSVKWNWIHF